MVSTVSGERQKERIEVREIIQALGEAELKYLDAMKTRRQLIGIVLMIIGFVSWILVLYVAISNPSQSFIWILAGLFISPLLMREGSIAIRDAKSIAIPGGGRYQVFSKIVCMECGYSEIRPWREGEYVGIKLSDKCPKCGGGLTVKAIFGEPEKKIRPIGMPILQMMGGQAKISGWELLRYYLLDLFTPFKIAFRWVAKKINQRERVV